MGPSLVNDGKSEFLVSLVRVFGASMGPSLVNDGKASVGFPDISVGCGLSRERWRGLRTGGAAGRTPGGTLWLGKRHIFKELGGLREARGDRTPPHLSRWGPSQRGSHHTTMACRSGGT
jgi:hypothetical protein